MARDGEATRTRILDGAQWLILDRGYGGMSVDQVIDSAGVTKGAFYHHFEGKAQLARAIVERYAESDAAHYREVVERAARLSDDPLQRILIAIGLMVEEVREAGDVPAGCVFASFGYQTGLFDSVITGIIRDALRFWTANLGQQFAEVIEKYPPRRKVDAEELADHFLAVYEGGLIMSRTTGDATHIERALLQYRDYIELVFSP